VPSALSRDFLCLAFTPAADKGWLYGGTASGDVVIAHVRSAAVYHSVFCSGGGVTSLVALPAPSHARAAPGGAPDYGGAPRAEGGVLLAAGAGDGTVTVYHHAVATLEADLVLAAAVSAATSAASGATRPTLAARTFVALRAVRLEGAVWSLAPLPPADAPRGGGGGGGGAPPPPLELLAGTSAGAIYRLREAPLSPSSVSGGAPGGGLSATLLSLAHAAAGETLDMAGAPALALAATPGAAALPAQLMATALIGGVLGVAFAPGASDFCATIGGDNTVRVWELRDYGCVALTTVRGAGHPGALVHGGEFHVTGWDDGSLRTYYSAPAADAPLGGGEWGREGGAGAAAGTGAANGFGAARDFGGSVAPERFAGIGGGVRSPARHGRRASVVRDGWVTDRDGGTSPARRVRAGDDRGHLWTVADAHAAKDGGVTALALAGNARFLVSGGGDGKVRVWDMRSRALVSGFAEHAAAVTEVAIYRDDAHVLSASRDRSFACYDLRRERRVSSHAQRVGGINALCLSRDQSLVITVGQERKLCLWDLREAAPVQSVSPAAGPAGEALCVAAAHGRDVVATGGSDGAVRFWDLRNSGRSLAV